MLIKMGSKSVLDGFWSFMAPQITPSLLHKWANGQFRLVSIVEKGSVHACDFNLGGVYGGSVAKDGQETQQSYNSSMSTTSGAVSSSFVRLSDNEISKILSIPMSLVAETNQGYTYI